MTPKEKKAFVKKMREAKEAKGLLRSQSKKVKKDMKIADKKGYYPKIKGYQVCSKCLKKKVGSRDAWFQDFTGQKRICNSCIDKLRKAKKS